MHDTCIGRLYDQVQLGGLSKDVKLMHKFMLKTSATVYTHHIFKPVLELIGIIRMHACIVYRSNNLESSYFRSASSCGKL